LATYRSKNAWVVYYRLADQKYTQLTGDFSSSSKEAWTPGRFCDHVGTDDAFGHCTLLGWLGTESMAWSPDSRHLYFSAFNRALPQKPFLRVLGSVDMASESVIKPSTFQPLIPDGKLATGYAAISPSGRRIALLRVSSATDRRTQLCIYDRNSRKLTQVTHTDSAHEAIQPHWRPN